MIELKVTGDTPEKFYANAMQTFALLMRGVTRPGAAQPAAAPVTPQPDADQGGAEAQPEPAQLEPAESAAPAETVAEPLENPKPLDQIPEAPAETAKRKPGRPRKQPETIEATAQPVSVANHALNDDISDLGLKPAPTVPEKAYTMEDCREQVRQALKNAEDRGKAKVVAAGLEGVAHENALKRVYPDAVTYVKPLLGKFNVVRVSDLKPEQFVEFMRASESYVQGTAVND
jgi:hypothetical protein